MELIGVLMALVLAVAGQQAQAGEVTYPGVDGGITIEDGRVIEEFVLGRDGEISFTKTIGPDSVVIEGELNGLPFRVETPNAGALPEEELDAWLEESSADLSRWLDRSGTNPSGLTEGPALNLDGLKLPVLKPAKPGS